jgi:hypothetical protein
LDRAYPDAGADFRDLEPPVGVYTPRNVVPLMRSVRREFLVDLSGILDDLVVIRLAGIGFYLST